MNLSPIVIEGGYVRLIPCNPDDHAAALHRASHGFERDALWRYLRDGPFPDIEAHKVHLHELELSGRIRLWAIADRHSQEILGNIALLRYDAKTGSIELGYILFLPPLQKQRGGTEASYLMLRFVFDSLQVSRCEWRCDEENEASQRAARRLGFETEKILHDDMIVKGRNRNTVIFAMSRQRWRSVRTVLEQWLDGKNFDAQGRQLSRLSCTLSADGLTSA